jgi:hypothetical protein
MALNFDFNSLNFGGNDQASNPMMQPVDLSQLDFSEPSYSGRGSPGTTKNPGTMESSRGGGSNFDKIINFGNSIADLLKIGSQYNTTSNFRNDEPMSVDQASIDAEEARSDELNNYIGDEDEDEGPTQQQYCEAKYGPGTTIERCELLDEQENLAEEASRGFVPSLTDLQQSGAEAAFVLPSGEVRTIMPGQDVASAFGRERGTRTFPVDEGSVTVPSELLAETMGLTPSLEDIQNVQPPQVATDDRSSFFTESAAREQRLRDRDRQPGETQAERDTRLARGKTLESRGASTPGGEMTFAEASKFVPRKENYRGEKERVSTRNNRIREFMARYNSDPQKASRKAAELLNQGRIIDNNLVQAKLDNYKRTSAQKYSDVVEVAELLVTDGRLTEEQAALFIVDEMGGDIKKLFAEPGTPSGGSDGKTDTPSLVGQLTRASGEVQKELPRELEGLDPANFTGQTFRGPDGTLYSSDGKQFIILN